MRGQRGRTWVDGALAILAETRGDEPETLRRLGVTLNTANAAFHRHGLSWAEQRDRAKYGAELVAAHKTPPPLPTPTLESSFEVPPPRAPNADGVERRLVLADLHMPVHSVSAVSCALQIARVLQPHTIVLAGDLANMSGLSHHPPYAVARETFAQSTGAVRAFLRALRRSVGSRIYVLEGNHEHWARDYEVLNAGTDGSFDVAVAFGLRARPDPEDPGVVLDATWVPEEQQPLVLGPVAYLHGTNGGEHYSKRYADTVGPRHGVKCVVTGHHHAFQFFSHKNGITAWGCGYLGDGRSEAFDYAKPPRGWEHGVLVQDIVGDTVTTHQIPISNGRAVVLGRIVTA